MVFFSRAQENQHKVLVLGNTTTLQENLNIGFIEFKMPSVLDEAKIQEVAQNYLDVFTVDFSASSHIAKITFLVNDNLSRMVVNRFLFSCQIDSIDFNGKNFGNFAFFNQFMKS
jgi:hypothetical protein